MTERIDEKDLPLTSAAPTDELRAVRGGKSVRVPLASLPASAAVQSQFATVQSQINALADGQGAGQLVYRTWAELSGVTGSVGEGAQVIDDAGTHTDPVVGGTVSNAGQYVWSDSPAGWRWVRADGLALKADKGEVYASVADAVRGATVEFNVGASSVAAGSPVSDATYVFASQIPRDGFIREVVAYGAGPTFVRQVKVRRFTRSGSAWEQSGEDYHLNVAPGLNVYAVNIPVQAGEYIGFYSPAGGVMFRNQEGTPYYNAAGDQTSFTDATATAGIHLEIGFKIQYWPFDSDDIAALQGTKALLEASFPVGDGTVGEREYNGLDFAPAAFTAWASMWDAGIDFPAGVRLSGLKVRRLHLAAGAVTLRVKRSYRLRTDSFVNSAPGNAGDVAIDTTDFSVASLGLDAGGAQDVTLSLPEFTAAPGCVVIHELTAHDSEGETVALGLGRSTLPGAAQYQLGFFRTTGGWQPSTTGLAFSVVGKIFTVPAGETQAIDAKTIRTPGCVAVHGHAGRFEFPFDNSTPKTHRLLMAVPAPFDGVRLVLAHGSTGSVHVARASVKAVGATTNVTDTSGFTAVTFDGSVDVTIPGVTGNDGIALVRSDVVPISSVARTDGGDLPLIVAQAYIDTAATINLMGRSDGGIDRTGWATHPEYPWIARYNDGDCVASPASFESTTNRSTTCIVGVELIARGQVVAVMSVGDSITNGEGSGITYPGASWAFEGCRALNNARPAYYAHFNLGWSGATTESFQRRVEAAFAAGILPDVLIIAAWSPNDISTTINANQITAMRRRVSSLLSLCQAHGVRPVLWTGIPTNATVKDFGASDSLRRAYNDAIRGFAGRGVMVLDFDAALAGATDGDGQVEIASGKTSDGIHPNDSGIADMAALVVEGLPKLGVEWPSALVEP